MSNTSSPLKMSNTPQQITLPQASEFGIESSRAEQIKAQFEPMLNKMAELEQQYNAIQREAEKGITAEISEAAKELRMQYVKVRTGTAKIHKEQKAFYLAAGRFVDGWKNTQEFASKGIEAKLLEIEMHQQRIEEARKEKLRSDRWALLQPYKDEEPAGLADMEEDVFNAYLTIAKQQNQDRIEAEARAEAERQRRELADKRERDILHLRNFWPEQMPDLGDISAEVFSDIVKGCEAREKEYIAEQERIARERAELERKAQQEAKAREAERKAAQEREAKLLAEAEAIRKAAEQKAEAERKAAAERERKAREEAEARERAVLEEAKRREEAAREQARKEAEEAARKEAERIEAERIAKEAEEAKQRELEAKKREARSDAAKLIEIAQYRPEMPSLKSPDAQWIAEEYLKLLSRAEQWVKNQVETKL